MTGSGKHRRLKILHIDPERDWGGGEAQVVGLLAYLIARGHDNQLLVHPQGQLAARSQSLKVSSIPMVVRNDLDLRGIPMLRSRIRREKYDIVHFHTKRAHALSLWLPRGEGCPKYVVTRRMDYPEKRNWYTGRLYNRRVDGVVAISQPIMQSLIDAGVEEKRIRLIHSGIDAHRFKAIGDRSIGREGEPVIGCLAVLEERKGHRYLLRAASILKARGLRVMLHLGGEGTLRGELEREVDNLGLREMVKFCGFVADPAAFLADVDLFVLPSLYEGLGVAVLEAMASGKAVVASRVGGLAESILDGQTGLLVPPRAPEALADAITRVVREPSLGRELGRKGRARVLEQFTLEQMAVKNENFYYELLGAGSS